MHSNNIEKQKLGFECHIHKATEKYILAGKKPTGFAEATNLYQTVAGALHALVKDCAITGLQTSPEHPDMFK